MKKLTKLASVFGFASAIAVTTAHGQIFTTISVDEFGIGSYNGTALAPAIPLPDPYNAELPGLAYTLPIPYTYAALVADIQLFEPPGSSGNGGRSDLLRFERNPTGQGTLLFFYSDASVPGDPADAPADVFGLPNPVTITPPLIFTETGLFGNPYTEAGPNGYVYLALPGMPGWDGNTAGKPTEYTFISDVPEPGAFFLLSGGLGILCGFKLLRRKVRS